MTKESFVKYMDDIVASCKHLDDFVNSLEITECVFDYDVEIPIRMLVDEFEPYSEDPLIFQAIINKRNGDSCFVSDSDNDYKSIYFDNWEQLYDILVEKKDKYEKEHKEGW